MASIGLNIPANVLERAIHIPKDLDAEGRKYPKIGDLLMKNVFRSNKKSLAGGSKRSKTQDRSSGRATGFNTLSDRLPTISQAGGAAGTNNLVNTGYNSHLYYKIENSNV